MPLWPWKRPKISARRDTPIQLWSVWIPSLAGLRVIKQRIYSCHEVHLRWWEQGTRHTAGRRAPKMRSAGNAWFEVTIKDITSCPGTETYSLWAYLQINYINTPASKQEIVVRRHLNYGGACVPCSFKGSASAWRLWGRMLRIFCRFSPPKHLLGKKLTVIINLFGNWGMCTATSSIKENVHTLIQGAAPAGTARAACAAENLLCRSGN